MKKVKLNLKDIKVESFITDELKGGRPSPSQISLPIDKDTKGSCGYFICEPSNPYPCGGNNQSVIA